ncbi:hypothetical protein ANCCAN_14914 [Ancylostoma caninum]|uniref:Uncharacterized protein n=1 Tax=Ancylostoma caninum TaxID=29170 RepID=A0A368G654_ANCCA|nr:hypothetical protein ANCCAN_14914 [Ancylostoma caninum]
MLFDGMVIVLTMATLKSISAGAVTAIDITDDKSKEEDPGGHRRGRAFRPSHRHPAEPEINDRYPLSSREVDGSQQDVRLEGKGTHR